MSRAAFHFLKMCLWLSSVGASAFATTPAVTVTSPVNNSTNGSAVHYVASATSNCAAGITAMRIYSAPGTVAYTANANRIDTTLNLAPGSYKTVIQAWDKCGGVGKISVNITVSKAPVVSVTSPANNSQNGSPVHFVASASSAACSSGIAAMRIYTAPGVSAYSVNADHLDTQFAVAAGNYQAIVQVWDKCGGVGKSSVNISVTGAQANAARFLYVVQAQPFSVSGFNVNPSTGVASPTAQGLVEIASSPSSVVPDKDGYRLYVGDRGGKVSAYFIDRRNGFLTPVPRSPFDAGDPVSGVAVHPSGKFVFASRVHGGVSVFSVAADGSLGEISGSPYPTAAGTNALTIDQSGKYLFVAEGVVSAANAGGSIPSYIDAYSVDALTGSLTPVPNSPYLMNPVSAACSVVPTDLAIVQGRFLYVADSYESAVSGYAIDAATGSLTEMKDSPFDALCADNNSVNNLNRPAAISVDPTGRFLYGANASANTLNVGFYGITGSGDVGTLAFLKTTASGTNCGFKVRTDPSGKFLYGFGNTGNTCSGAPILAGYAIDSATGDLTPISMPANVLGAPFALAVTP